jgi:hypothetical protein
MPGGAVVTRRATAACMVKACVRLAVECTGCWSLYVSVCGEMRFVCLSVCAWCQECVHPLVASAIGHRAWPVALMSCSCLVL